MDQVLGRAAPYRGKANNRSPDPVVLPENHADYFLSEDDMGLSVR